MWSINLGYEKHVLPAVYAVAADLGIRHPVVPITEPIDDRAPLSAFIERYHTVEQLVASTSRHRTSTRSGILKADAALLYAKAIRTSADTLDEALRLLEDTEQLDAVNAVLSNIPGEGQDEVRRGYLWMLVGDNDSIKPDRMVLRWFEHHGVPEMNPVKAKQLVRDIVPNINARNDSPRQNYTAWEVDKALWEAGKQLPASVGSKDRRVTARNQLQEVRTALPAPLFEHFEQASADRGLSIESAVAAAISQWIETAR
ncbi:MAG: hypothetical protein K2X52_09020 [Mycobacteriaceae bacterium]|nr:hypothetical protein [Mycobacteriaceae bacterium]